MKKDLTKGNILQSLVQLAIPIVGASFMQFMYNFVDMIWVGKLGASAVAAVGTSGFFIHLGWGLSSILLMGNGVNVSQALGAKEESKAKQYAYQSLITLVLLLITYITLIQLNLVQLIDFFDLDSKSSALGVDYLGIASFGIFFLYMTQLMTNTSNAWGDSKTPFRIVSVGVLINIILDPILIFYFDMGVKGAAWASVISQVISALIFYVLRSRDLIQRSVSYFKAFNQTIDIVKIGFPAALQRIIFNLVAIFMAKIVAQWGASAIAAQKIGLQLEALTFMTMSGMAGAVLSFTGQNYGAQLYHRVWEGYKKALNISMGIGMVMSMVLFFGAENLMRIFIQDSPTIAIGVMYLKIIGASQLFMCVEMVTSSVTNGLGKTQYTSTINILLTVIRLPMAIYLSHPDRLGVDGVWWSIFISTFIRAIAQTSVLRFLRSKILVPKLINE